MHDVQYRAEVARQQTTYNQPSYPAFYLGSDIDWAGCPCPVVEAHASIRRRRSARRCRALASPIVAEHLTMNTVIHAAVRRDIARFSAALEDFPVGSKPRAEQLNRAWRFLDKQLEDHHHSEEEIFWPALRELGADESLVSDLNGEHDRMAQAMTLTRDAMAALAAEPSQAHVERARAAVADPERLDRDPFRPRGARPRAGDGSAWPTRRR